VLLGLAAAWLAAMLVHSPSASAATPKTPPPAHPAAISTTLNGVPGLLNSALHEPIADDPAVSKHVVTKPTTTHSLSTNRVAAKPTASRATHHHEAAAIGAGPSALGLLPAAVVEPIDTSLVTHMGLVIAPVTAPVTTVLAPVTTVLAPVIAPVRSVLAPLTGGLTPIIAPIITARTPVTTGVPTRRAPSPFAAATAGYESAAAGRTIGGSTPAHRRHLTGTARTAGTATRTARDGDFRPAPAPFVPATPGPLPSVPAPGSAGAGGPELSAIQAAAPGARAVCRGVAIASASHHAFATYRDDRSFSPD
jgi:hypothetical protein